MLTSSVTSMASKTSLPVLGITSLSCSPSRLFWVSKLLLPPIRAKMESRGCRAGEDAMVASAQAARMGQVDEFQEEASTSEASSAHMHPWRHSSSSSSSSRAATDTGILLADGELGSEQHKIDKKRAIEKFFKEKEKRRRLGMWHPGMLVASVSLPLSSLRFPLPSKA